MQIHWHRRDLRVADNRALADAAAEGEVLPVFVFDDEVLTHGAPPRVAFMLDALASLREWYRERGSDLVVIRGDPSVEIPALAARYDAERVVWNDDYSGLAQERDRVVAEASMDEEVEVETFDDALLHEPGSIRTNDGDVYSVYTYFRKKWCDREKSESFDPPSEDALADVSDDEDLPTLSDLGFEEPEASIPAAGTESARDLLETFCDGPIRSYAEDRDYPARGGTSHLSVHLKFGTIGIREVWAATEDAMEGANGEDEHAAVEEYQSQLGWREFYAHVLWNGPEVVTANFKDYRHDIEWRNDADELAAWKEGKTGYPIVDAGMRQLREEAWVHNRVRMIVASFLTKDLLHDWRAGYDWYRRKLVDHDTANDNGGWQWAASTGTDAQPYFRVFNPMTQGERYDPDAEYIGRYVPELAEVDPETVHAWHELSDEERESVTPDYPAPIVDHGERREAAISMFEAARGDD